jgi:outer membrane lipoprotein LolB
LNLRACISHAKVGIFSLALTAVLPSCALFSSPPQQASLKATGHWEGRLSLKVLQQPPEQFSANFELNGLSEAGELYLYSAIGTTLAVARWNPQNAQMQQGQAVQTFESMDALTKTITGSALPVPALMAWLDQDGPELPGWTLKSESTPSGRRIYAQRQTPLPALQLTLLVDPRR